MKRSDIVGLHRIKNKPSRNAFDLSHRHMFTAQVGELLPIFNTWVNPGDTLKLGYNGLSRTAPLQTAAFTRLKENVQYYFVPFQSLWKYFEQVVNNMTEGQSGQNISRFAKSFDKPEDLGTSLPYISYSDICTILAELLYVTRDRIFTCYNYLKGNNKDVSDVNSYIDYLSIQSSDKIICFGVLRYALVSKLLNYLGYGNFPLMHYDMISQWISFINSNPSVITPDAFTSSSFGYVQPSAPAGSPNLSILPLLAYHKIVNDHYRYQQWQPFESWTCNIDFITPSSSMDITKLSQLKFLIYGLSNTLFDMEFSNLPLDYFNGVLPRAQYGDESSVALDGSSVSSISLSDPEVTTNDVVSLGGNPRPLSVQANDVGTVGPNNAAKLVINSSGNHSVSSISGSSNISLDSSLKISALRSAIALQKYKEVQGSNDSDFASQVLAHFGIKPKIDDRMSKFIGGSDSVIDINPQINQNLTGDNEAQIKAIATGDLSAGCKFTSDTYGIVIGIYRCVPQLDFSHVGLDRQLLKTDASDFVIPELDSIGMQTQYRFEVASSPVGYPVSSSYCEYKTSFDRVDGAFNSVLSSWVTGYDSKVLLNWANGQGQISDLLVCRPSICYPIFQEQVSLCTANDKIFVGSVNTCVAIRNLSVHGLPYTK